MAKGKVADNVLNDLILEIIRSAGAFNSLRRGSMEYQGPYGHVVATVSVEPDASVERVVDKVKGSYSGSFQHDSGNLEVDGWNPALIKAYNDKFIGEAGNKLGEVAIRFDKIYDAVAIISAEPIVDNATPDNVPSYQTYFDALKTLQECGYQVVYEINPHALLVMLDNLATSAGNLAKVNVEGAKELSDDLEDRVRQLANEVKERTEWTGPLDPATAAACFAGYIGEVSANLPEEVESAGDEYSQEG